MAEVSKSAQCGLIWKRFRAQTTAHGVPHVDNAIGKPKRTFWAIISLGCVAFLTYHITVTSMYFASRPVTVNINLVKETQLTFPAVTFCNMNPIKSSALSGSSALQSVLGNTASTRRRRAVGDTVPTFGGTANGAVCTFPFTYNSVSYTSCTSIDRSGPWCYTSGTDWGYCIQRYSCPNAIYDDVATEDQICWWDPQTSPSEIDFQAAIDLCDSKGGTLFTLKDGDQYNHITTAGILTIGIGKRTWMYIKKTSSGAPWLHYGTDTVSWTNWPTGYPTNAYLCVAIGGSAGTMRDNENCNLNNAYPLCQIISPFVPTTVAPTTTMAVTTTEEVTTTPEITTTPEVTTTPEITTTPEVTTTPEITTTPEVTTIPEITTTPEVTTTPEITTTPEVTTTSEITTTPEVTTTSEITTTSTTTTTTTPTTTTPTPDDTELRESFSKREQVLEVMADMSAEEKQSLGYKPSEFILDCEYAGYTCHISEFSFFYDAMHGNCYTFNSGWNGTEVQKSTRPGRRYGLKVVLNINQKEYVEDLGEAAGVGVVVHPQSDMPFPQDDGILAPPGQLTAIGIRLNEINRIGEPHGVCTETTEPHTDINVFEETYPVNYSTNACLKTCYQKRMIDMCGCADAQYLSTGEAFGNNVPEFCAPDIKAFCVQRIMKWYEENVDTCECASACKEKRYISEVSSAQWPSDISHAKLFDTMDSKLSSVNGSNIETFRDNILKVEVYFKHFNTEKILEKAAYPDATFISDLGGILGLWIGCSVLSLFEFIELAVEFSIVGLFCKRCRKSKKAVSPNNTRSPPPPYSSRPQIHPTNATFGYRPNNRPLYNKPANLPKVSIHELELV